MQRASRRLSWAVLVSLVFAIAPSLDAQNAATGTWVTYNFGGIPNFIDLQVNGAAVTGTISRNNEVNQIYDGAVNGNTVTFKANAFAGSSPIRTITYTGRLNGDQISFTRAVQVIVAGGAGIYGSGGPMEFAAMRDSHPARTATRPLIGEWRLNIARSTYDPGPPPTPLAPDGASFVALPDGRLVLTLVAIGVTGGPVFNMSVFAPDGRDYPLQNQASLAELMTSGTATTFTRSLVALSDRAFEMTSKANGVITSTRRMTLSPDGASLTVAEMVVNAQGQVTGKNSLFYERRQPNRPPTD